MNARRGAFSLIELMMVLLVLGVLAGVAAPRYSTAMAWQRLEAASRRLAADLRMARNEAVRLSSPRTVEFFVDEDRYGVPTMTDPNHGGQTYEVRLGQTSYAVDLTTADFGGDSAVTFDVYGMPSAAGVVTLAQGGEQRTLTVTAAGNINLP